MPRAVTCLRRSMHSKGSSLICGLEHEKVLRTFGSAGYVTKPGQSRPITSKSGTRMCRPLSKPSGENAQRHMRVENEIAHL